MAPVVNSYRNLEKMELMARSAEKNGDNGMNKMSLTLPLIFENLRLVTELCPALSGSDVHRKVG